MPEKLPDDIVRGREAMVMASYATFAGTRCATAPPDAPRNEDATCHSRRRQEADAIIFLPMAANNGRRLHSRKREIGHASAACLIFVLLRLVRGGCRR